LSTEKLSTVAFRIVLATLRPRGSKEIPLPRQHFTPRFTAGVVGPVGIALSSVDGMRRRAGADTEGFVATLRGIGDAPNVPLDENVIWKAL
jgi:hypothetical protein